MGKEINKYIATIERFGSRFAKQIIETIVPPAIMLFALFTLFGLVFYIILRATKPDYQLFELATISALLGGFVLASGFIGQNDNKQQFKIKPETNRGIISSFDNCIHIVRSIHTC